MSIILHIDANSAYLSWEAVRRLNQGDSLDLRTIPSVIAGDPKKRHGIILAKSIPAKSYGIQTAESLHQARIKCPHLTVLAPDHDLYLYFSDLMYDLLSSYSPLIQRYSVDECFLDYTDSMKLFGDPEEAAHKIRRRIREELGFTVNIGVGPNKLLAKMASEMEKPDQVHTLWRHEIEEKLWPLPIADLFMVGRVTAKKLQGINIRTIGDLATQDPAHITALLKKPGRLIWNYANGIDDSLVLQNDEIIQKGLGNSTTTPIDVTCRKDALMVVLALTERVSHRLRRLNRACSLVSISFKTSHFSSRSHQIQLPHFTHSTSEIYSCAVRLFDEIWKGEPLRQMGVHLSGFSRTASIQLSFFDAERQERSDQFDQTVDAIRMKYGDLSITRGCFAKTSASRLESDVSEGDYIGLSSDQ